MNRADHHAWLYEIAKAWLLNSEFAPELDWMASRSLAALREPEFLQEAAWVVLCSGFRERVVRNRFGRISLAFFDWESAHLIVSDAENCVRIARTAFANEKKLQAIVCIAEAVARRGFADFKYRLQHSPVGTLRELPFIGPITAQHLLKNLGVATAKADRHLVRLAASLGYSDCHELCAEVAVASGDSVAVVDSVLWRFAEQAFVVTRVGTS